MSDNATEASAIESVMIFPCATEAVLRHEGCELAGFRRKRETVSVLCFECFAKASGGPTKPKPTYFAQAGLHQQSRKTG